MTIRADSFSSVAEVVAYTRHLLDGQPTFNSATRPTGTEVEKFIDRASGVLNVAIAQAGFSPATLYANSTAKLMCDDFVTARATEYVELTQRGTGYSDKEGNRHSSFRNMTKSANDFINMNSQGFIRLGVSQTYKLSDGLAFTGLDAQKDRSDRDDTGIEQPVFDRHQWDNHD